MVTRPAGPIQLLSKANFRKYETPISNAAIPMRFNQCEPMRDSRSESVCTRETTEGLGGMYGGGDEGRVGWTETAGNGDSEGLTGSGVSATADGRCSTEAASIWSLRSMR